MTLSDLNQPPFLSVVVPTHNRARYAIRCIEAVLSIPAPQLELVVSDTSTDRALQDWLQGDGRNVAVDTRLRYRKLDYPSNVTLNHNDAMAMATGQFVMVIGDDDCITSAAIDAAQWAAANDVPAISQTQSSIYAWPDFRSQTARGGHAGRLYVPRGNGKVRWRRAEDDVRTAAQRAFQATDGLPRTYHGIVRRDLFLNLHERTGQFYHGSSPDMSAAIAIACMVERYPEVDLPFSISGISSGSNSGRSAMNTHRGELSSDPQTREFEARGWPPGVPRLFSVETVWAHAGLEILGKLRSDLLPCFNYARLLALCRLRHDEFSEAIDRAESEVLALCGRRPDVEREIRHLRFARAKYWLGRLAIPTAAHGRRFFADIGSILEASQCYEEYARSTGLAFAKLTAALEAGRP